MQDDFSNVLLYKNEGWGWGGGVENFVNLEKIGFGG